MMSYGTLGDTRRRRRRTIIWRLTQIALFVATLIGTASYAYQIGVSASQARAGKLEDDLERFQSDNLLLRERLDAAWRQSQGSGRALERLQARYDAEVPGGELKDLMAGLEEQLQDGVTAERLRLMIDVAGRAPACEEEPETKRFRLQTPIATGAVHVVRFGGGRVAVRGSGEPARNEAGLSEAWYDPGAPVELVFETLGGERSEVAGSLPLRHTMVVDGTEFRFSAIAGERSFVEVTAQACPLQLWPFEAQEGEGRRGPRLDG